MWVYYCGSDTESNEHMKNIVLYDYHNSRAADCVVDYLDSYDGYLQVNGYAAYGKTDVILAGCMAHARRKFIDTKTVQGKNKTGKADVALNLMGKLYGIEASLKGKTAEEKHLARQEKSKVIIDKLTGCVIDNKDKIPPKSKLGEALTYCCN
ncbi:MAG: transposase [Colwellia sp.]|jgi:transposase